MRDNMKIFLVIASALALFAVILFSVGKVGATVPLPSCGTETYEFFNDGVNTRVAISVHDSDEEINVTGLNGWTVTDLWLAQEGGGTNYVHFSGGNRNNFNPPSFGDIDKTKVQVTKACPTPTPTP